jgi:opacity protein-like surface antigen
MKKIVYLIILFLATAVVANGQLFVGGSIGFNTASGSTEIGGVTSDNPTTLSMNFNPKIGFILSDNFWAGINLSLGLTHSNSNGDPEVIGSTTSIGVQPFVRYYAYRVKKFSIFGQAQAGVSFGSSKNKVGDVTNDGPKTTTIGVSITPGMAFDLSSRVQLEASLNFFNLGVNHTISKDGDDTDKSTTAGLGINLNNIETSGSITIGAIIKL